MAGAGVGKGRWFVLFQWEPERTGNLRERFHLKRDLYCGMPVVSALVYLEVLADVFDADWFYIKIQAVARLVRNGLGRDVWMCTCVQHSNAPLHQIIQNPGTFLELWLGCTLPFWCAGL